MTTTRKLGLLVLTGVGIGFLVSHFLPNLFNFAGPGTGKGEVGVQQESKEATTTSAVAPDIGGPEKIIDTDPEPVVPSEVVFVLIDDRTYLLRRGPEGKAAYKPADLDTVIEAAQAATGDSNGIRVRIAEKSSARELTERALREGLEKAGIPGDAVRWKDEPVE